MAYESVYPRLNRLGHLIMNLLGKQFGDLLDASDEPGRIHAFADLYWRALLGVAGVVLILVFLYSTWQLLGILDAIGKTPDTEAFVQRTIDRSKLNATVQVFDARAAEFESLKTNPPAAVKDPSM